MSFIINLVVLRMLRLTALNRCLQEFGLHLFIYHVQLLLHAVLVVIHQLIDFCFIMLRLLRVLGHNIRIIIVVLLKLMSLLRIILHNIIHHLQ